MWFALHLSPASDDSALRNRIAALEIQANAPRNAADKSAVAELNARMDRIEQALAKVPAAAPANSERLAATESSMKSLGAALAALNRRAEESAAAVVAAREQAEAAAKATQALQARFDALEQSARATQDKVAQGGGADVAARRAVAFLALRDAVMRGAPFAAELVAAKAVVADPAVLAPLESFAASGVPTEAALAREFTALLPALMDAAGADAARAGGFFARLQANAGKLVRIHPVGEPTGDDPSAVLARLEVKAAHNDIAGIENELGKLPPKARTLAEPWRKKAAVRAAAVNAVRKLAVDSAAALGAH
jgi:hypothetical protein